jgi:long-chain acyl-CoA synthetase
MTKMNTLNDIFLRIAAAGSPKAVIYQDASGVWQPLSSAQIYQRTRALAQAFLGWGIQKGDRIAILAENRWEWAISDFAVLAIGAIDVPIYPTLTAEQISILLQDSACRIAIVSTRALYDKIESIRSQTAIEHVILMDDEGTPDAVPISTLLRDADAFGAARDPEFDARIRSIQPQDLATLIYTSGTTGEPKGVMLSHGNIAANLSIAGQGYDFKTSDCWISFLPLSHITARALDYILLHSGATLAYCPAFDKLPQTMQQVKPTVFVAVPRVYEKIRQAVEQKAALSATKRSILHWSLGVGHRHRRQILAGEQPSSPFWKLANKLVFSKINAAFGGRVRYFVSGGAPLGMDTAGWFADAGIRILEGYGLTETSPVIAINSPKGSRIGSVGKVLSNLEIKLAADGELLVRGPSVFSGYWQKLVATSEAFDEEGWFRTGDIAHLDADGFLYVTDRKKELLKTSGGKLIAPQPIENQLKANLLVAQAALVGDKHKFAAVLISPNFAALEEWARHHGIEALTRRQLVSDQRVLDEYQQIVNHVNAKLANFESIKRIKVVAEEWSIDTGELTPSMKLKRRVIAERYAEEIAAFYFDEAVARAV